MPKFEKEMCGKNVYFINKNNRIVIYDKKKKVGEIETNENKEIVTTKFYKKEYAQNFIFYVNLHTELTITDIKGFPNKYCFLNQIKERIHPDLLLKYAIKCKSVNLVDYALEREASFSEETMAEAASYCNKILLMHFHNGFKFNENLIENAFLNKNYETIRTLSRRTNNLESYIERCNSKENYQAIKKILVKELIKRNKT
jgi:hypothetical protein